MTMGPILNGKKRQVETRVIACGLTVRKEERVRSTSLAREPALQSIGMNGVRNQFAAAHPLEALTAAQFGVSSSRNTALEVKV
jgi:hypothetical protein